MIRNRDRVIHRQIKYLVYLPALLTGLVFGLLICAGCWVWLWIKNPQTLPFQHIKVEGEFQHLHHDIISQQVSANLTGGFFSINLPKLKKQLEKIAWVETVGLKRTPGVLIVTVKEQHPVAVWNNSDLLNEKGNIFAVPTLEVPTGLPFLQGPQDTQSTVLNQYQQLNTLFIPLHLQIQKLEWNARENWEMELDNGIAVTLGREDILAKVTRLVKWYPQLVGDKASEIKHLDLRYQNGIAMEYRK